MKRGESEQYSWMALIAALAAAGLSGCGEKGPVDGPPVDGEPGTGATGGTGSAVGVGGDGSVGGGSDGGSAWATGGTGSVELPPFAAPEASLRRLTRSQFKNAIFDLLEVDVDTSRLDPDSFDGHFSVVGAASVVVSELGVERYHEAIEAAVDAVFASDRRGTLVGCAASEQTCARDFLTRFGRRAYRRTLSEAELDRLLGVASTAEAELEDAYEGLRWAAVATLASPSFLYRTELGDGPASSPSRLTAYELATRLAFLIWNSPPDEELLDAAESGDLDSAEGIRARAEAMLNDPRGSEAAGAFAEDYLRLDRIVLQAKDQGLFPQYTPVLKEAMVRDMRSIWEQIAIEEDGDLLGLFSTPRVVVNRELAQLYGLDATGLDSTSVETRTLPAEGIQVGILGKPAFLSQFANQKEGSPTLRGKFIREAILCTPVEPPPGNVALELPESSPDRPTTKRERLDVHREHQVCASCHEMMDPLGLPFESFDAIGRFRTLDNGLPVDPTGSFDGVAVANARELGDVMAASANVARCLVEKYYSYATGHEVRDVDAIVVRDLAGAFSASGHRLRRLILDIVASDAFAAVVSPAP